VRLRPLLVFSVFLFPSPFAYISSTLCKQATLLLSCTLWDLVACLSVCLLFSASPWLLCACFFWSSFPLLCRLLPSRSLSLPFQTPVSSFASTPRPASLLPFRSFSCSHARRSCVASFLSSRFHGQPVSPCGREVSAGLPQHLEFEGSREHVRSVGRLSGAKWDSTRISVK
jgi:hypothetical protein